ncbi:hypothetical protein [Rubrivirga marina]|uniref:MotA/TolQ/ExbB proton channel domain-containing protein n=1 Tax=Rubrivirga marina TaxID=1196024 RepID=A0A271J681_9BACT|nr:hypothetical protein [Rubrivirga marina]PAP78465.1 hypothetical protein BSZ37_19555 [Rubrivirga marina]
MRLALLSALLAVGASAQPTASALPRLTGSDAAPSLAPEPGITLVTAADWEPPPALVAAGIALDGVFLVGGTAFAVWMAVGIAEGLPEAGLAAPALIGVGGLLVLTSGAAAIVGGIDLLRVARGDAPFLARMFDPNRPRPRRPPAQFPPPGRPPWSPPQY